VFQFLTKKIFYHPIDASMYSCYFVVLHSTVDSGDDECSGERIPQLVLQRRRFDSSARSGGRLYAHECTVSMDSAAVRSSCLRSAAVPRQVGADCNISRVMHLVHTVS